MNRVVRRKLSIVAVLAIAVGSTIGCSDPPVIKTSDIHATINEVTLPEDPCNPMKDPAPIRVRIFTDAGATGGTRYVMTTLKQISGDNQDAIYCCPWYFYTESPSQVITLDIIPPLTLPNGVYEVSVGITTDEDAAHYCIVDSAKVLRNVTNQYYINGTSNCGPRVQLYYNCQYNYDIRYGNELIGKLNTVFGEEPVYDTLVLKVGSTYLNNETIFDNNRLREFIQSYWRDAFVSQFDSMDICLMAIEDVNRANFPSIGNAGGFSSGFEFTTDGLGQRGAWSIVFVRHIKALPWDSKFDKTLLLRCATHELGHARANLTHPTASPLLHEADFQCVMDSLDIQEPGTNEPYTNEYNRFCSDCRDFIGLIPWP